MGEESKRGPGRPPAASPTSVLSVRVPVAVYDHYIQQAAATGQTVSAVVLPKLAISVNNKSRG